MWRRSIEAWPTGSGCGGGSSCPASSRSASSSRRHTRSGAGWSRTALRQRARASTRRERNPSTLRGPAPSRPSELPPLEDPANVGGLAGVLHVVDDDADQPDAQGHGWVPALVDNPVKIGVGQPADVSGRDLVDGVVILAERLRGE